MRATDFGQLDEATSWYAPCSTSVHHTRAGGHDERSARKADLDGQDNQRFRFHQVGAYVRIMAAHSGHYLAAGNPKYTDGHRINQHVCADVDNQLWFLTRRHGHYTIRNKQTGRCLEVPAGAGGDVNLQVYRCHSGG